MVGRLDAYGRKGRVGSGRGYRRKVGCGRRIEGSWLEGWMLMEGWEELVVEGEREGRRGGRTLLSIYMNGEGSNYTLYIKQSCV